MHTDLPLDDINDDKLGRYLFANEIASGLVNSFSDNNESIVLGINGAWGSGKSTLINFVIQEIKRITSEQNKEIITLRFNPWMFSGQKELQNIFLMALLLKLQNNTEVLKDASGKVADFLTHLSWLKYVHSGAGEAIDTVKGFLDGVNKKKDLSQLKEDVDELLIESKVKLYITIDDIDRLAPSEITDIFQLVKLNGNFANTIFILAYDQDVVTSALRKQFGDNGKKYIEKIVQIDYTLPAVSRDNIKRIFIDSLSKLFGDGDVADNLNNNLETLKNQRFVNFLTSIRDIYRFNNSIKLRLPSIYQELNIIEFFTVEAIRIFNPKAYQFIIDNKDGLVYKSKGSTHRVYSRYNDTNEEVKASEIIDKSEFDDLTKSLLASLFSVSGNLIYLSVSEQKLIVEKRVANKNYFDRYFNLQLSNLDIQESVFESFLKDTPIDEKESVLNEIHKEKKLFQFLNWVEFKSRKVGKGIIENIISACLNFSNSLPYFKESMMFIHNSDFMTLVRFINKMLNDIDDVETNQKLIMNHIKKPKGKYSFSSFFIAHSILLMKEKLDEGKLYYNHFWYAMFIKDGDNDKFLDKISKLKKTSVKDIFIQEMNSDIELNEDEVSLMVSTMQNLHPTYCKNNFHRLIEDDHVLIKYLWTCIKSAYMTSSGTNGSYIAYQLAGYQLYNDMDRNIIKTRLETLNRDDFEEDENKVINFYLKAYEDGFKEKVYYNIDTSEVMKED